MNGGKVKVASLVQSAPTGRLEPTPTTGINEDDTTAYVLCRQALDIVSGRLFDTSFRKSGSNASPRSKKKHGFLPLRLFGNLSARGSVLVGILTEKPRQTYQHSGSVS